MEVLSVVIAKEWKDSIKKTLKDRLFVFMKLNDVLSMLK